MYKFNSAYCYFFSQFPKHTKTEPPPLISKHRLFTHCCVMSYNQVVSCHVISCDVTPFHAVSCDTKLCHTTSCHLIRVTPSRRHIMSQYILSNHIMCYPNFLASHKCDLCFFFRWVDTSYKIKLSNVRPPTTEGRARKSTPSLFHAYPSGCCATNFLRTDSPFPFERVPGRLRNKSRWLDFASLKKISLLFPLSSHHSWIIQMPAHPW